MNTLIKKFIIYTSFYIGEFFSLLAFKYNIPYTYKIYNWCMNLSSNTQEKLNKFVIWEKAYSEFEQFEKEMIQEQKIYSK